ncbi:MAG: S-layer homology domain-containing protein [Armatimonadetes bacterium]|nr:S-layer homology domain-containing protein [Armatimonadota bacterium]
MIPGRHRFKFQRISAKVLGATGALFLAAAVAASFSPCLADNGDSPKPKPSFSDVPLDHWAAPAVSQIAEMGIIKGYPDSTFKGDRPVTRYELAVAIARFAEFVDLALKTVVSSPQKSATDKGVDCPVWARNSIELLRFNQVLPADSPIIREGQKAATAEDLAQALASLAARIVEVKTADPGPSGEQ